MRWTEDELRKVRPELAKTINSPESTKNCHDGQFFVHPGGQAHGLERAREYRTKTEARFAAWLETNGGDWLAWSGYECWKLRIAKATFWLPDFVCWWRFNTVQVGTDWPQPEPLGFTIPGKNFIQLIDVKMAHGNRRRTEWKDDTRVKIKTVARLYPFFHVVAVTWTGETWEWEEFQPWH